MCCSSRGRQELITQWCLNCRIRSVWLLLGESELILLWVLLREVLDAGESNAKCRLSLGSEKKGPDISELIVGNL